MADNQAHVTITYDYDELNRVESRTYNDGTPDVTYTYDTGYTDLQDVFHTVANAKGRLTQVRSSVSTYNYLAYDSMGRVRGSSQTVDGSTFSMPDYQYDRAGNLTSEQYPTNLTVKTEYDRAGRVAGVKNFGMDRYYAGGDPAVPNNPNVIRYAAHGAASAVRLGNGLWEHTNFNSRLQPTQIGLGTSGTNSSVLQLDYGYGTTDNNGNLRSQTVTVPGAASSFAQTYSYDELNRLKSAEETAGGASTWKQVYSYDPYGNRSLASGTTYPAQLDAATNPAVSAATNRITSPGYAYDAAGNLLCDPAHPCGQGQQSLTPYYAYDAENRMKSAGGGYEGGGTTYSYDCDGRRVKKATPYNGGVRVFVYDAFGRLAAEYADWPEFGETSYLTQDSLGSTRVVTNKDGSASRHDYLPFGQEIGAGVGGRTEGQGYVGDNVAQKFTGYERDAEIGLDYAQARYYASVQGRFTSPDPLMRSARIGSPQTFNRYSYVLNNPLSLNDPTGLQEQDRRGERNSCETHKCKTEIVIDIASGAIVSNRYYIDEDGERVEVTTTKIQGFDGSPVAGFQAPIGVSTAAAEVAPSVFSRVAGGVGSALGRMASAIGMILTMPSTVQAPTLPPVDISRNPNPEDNKKDFEKGKRHRAVWNDGREKERF